MILENVFINTEVFKDIRPDLFHLLCVHRERLAFNLLDVRIGVREQEQTAAFSTIRKILFREPLAFVRQIFGLAEVGKLGHESVCSRRLHALFDALIIHVDQVHRGEQRVIAFAEEVVAVLHPGHDAAVFQLHGHLFTVGKLIAQIRNLVILHDLASMRQRGIDAADFPVLIPHRHEETGVVVVEDRCRPRKKLCPCLKLVRAFGKLPLQRRLCRAEGLHIQFGNVRCKRVNAGPYQLGFVNLAGVISKARFIAVKHTKRALKFAPLFGLVFE